jgi:hypothetical protein
MDETSVIKYIRDNIVDIELQKTLIQLISSKEKNEKLLCVCLLIDIKNGSLNESDCSVFCKDCSSIDDNCALYNKKMSVICRNNQSNRSTFAKIVSLNGFADYFGKVKHLSKKRIDLEIDSVKIREETGWSGPMGVAWVTEKEKLLEKITKSEHEPFPANNVCDFVGFSRKPDGKLLTTTPKHLMEFAVIHYSDKFCEKVYQPNSSNANWFDKDILYISYKDDDGFGRTYHENTLNKRDFAKEQVHEKSNYYDDNFKAFHIGKALEDIGFNRDKILDEAYYRLEIEI